MKIKITALLVMATAIMSSCALFKGQDKVYTKETKSGMPYTIIKPAQKGPRIKKGDIVFLHITYTNSKDSLLFSSWENAQPIILKMEDPMFKGDLMEGLALLTQGDSARFGINADSLFQKTFGMDLPPFIEKGSNLNFIVKVNRVTTEEAFNEEQKAETEAMQKLELLGIENYFLGQQLPAQKTESGLYYAITKTGTGPNPQPGQTVRVHYTGTLLDGTKFDSSLDRGDPLEFVLGKGMVIKGWDEGIGLLNTGAKGILGIPSNLAYGERGAGATIGPNTPLIFEVELVEIK